MLNNWDIKDINIQVAQAVNLAASQLNAKKAPFESETVKKLARDYYQVISELKEEKVAEEKAKDSIALDASKEIGHKERASAELQFGSQEVENEIVGE